MVAAVRPASDADRLHPDGLPADGREGGRDSRRGQSTAASPYGKSLLQLWANTCSADLQVKHLICAQPGIADELEWETSYTGTAGGILTVQSELVSAARPRQHGL